MYSMELSLFVLEAGIKLLAERRPDLLYLSLTDWVQHKYAPGRARGRSLLPGASTSGSARLAALGAVVALTADHGMNDKSNADGSPNVIWLQDILDAEVRQGPEHGDLPDHRRVRRPPRRARRLRARLLPRARLDAQEVMRVAGELPGVERRPRQSLCRAAVRAACRPRRRRGGDQRYPHAASAPPRQTTTSRASRVTGCAPTAASPRDVCRSSSTTPCVRSTRRGQRRRRCAATRSSTSRSTGSTWALAGTDFRGAELEACRTGVRWR